MAERKQVNKYYPPDFDPRRHKNLDKYHNSHALRERAKKIDQGILVIRFEMPYDIWCEGCKIHIAMGVRYNAEKRKVGYYYSTPIYRFRMKCHLCENYFEIETDPKNVNYKIMFGAQRKNEKWDMAKNEQVLTEDRQVVKKLASDAMFKLEHGVEDKKKLVKAAPTLSDIVDIQSGWQDDYMQNRMLRDKFRKEKKDLKEEELKDKALLEKSSLEIDLVPETEEDRRLAGLLKYSTVESYDEKQRKKRSEIQNQSIFAASTSTPSSSSSSSSSENVDTTPSRLEKLTQQLGKIKKKSPGGFGVFDTGVKRKKNGTVSGIVLKKKMNDLKGAAGEDEHRKLRIDLQRSQHSDVREDVQKVDGVEGRLQGVDGSRVDSDRTQQVPCGTNGPTCYSRTTNKDVTPEDTDQLIMEKHLREATLLTRNNHEASDDFQVNATKATPDSTANLQKEDSQNLEDNMPQECPNELTKSNTGGDSNNTSHQGEVSLVGDYYATSGESGDSE